MRRIIYRAYSRLIEGLSTPVLAEFFLRGDVGREYGIGLRDKLQLMRQIRTIVGSVEGATGYFEHLLLAAQLLSIPRSVRGDVVECGCFKGRSTCTLSLVCQMVRRQLTVYDSFEGLPEVSSDDRVHISAHMSRYEVYQKGDYKGTLDQVRSNVKQFGSADLCRFVPGYFEQSLPGSEGELAFAFLDVDLHESLKTCLRHLWPLLQDGGYLFTHEASQLPFAAIFFDEQWWRGELGCSAPGLVGAGCGLPAGFSVGCGIGYARKLPNEPTVHADPRFHQFCGDPTQTK